MWLDDEQFRIAIAASTILFTCYSIVSLYFDYKNSNETYTLWDDDTVE